MKKEQNRVQGVNGEKRSKQVCTVKGGISDDWLQRERERERQGERHIRDARKPCELQGPNLA